MAAKGTALVQWDKKFAQHVVVAQASVAGIGVGNKLSVKGGFFSYGNAPIKDNKVPCVIVGDVPINAYYEGKFDPDTPEPPICYAFGLPTNYDASPAEQALAAAFEMAPHPKSSKPQSKTCKECKWNVYGTADTGRGKACGNKWRLQVAHGDYLKGPNELKKAPAVFLDVPVTSVASWAAYLRSLTNVLGRPPYSILTEMTTAPDAKTQFKVVFNAKDKIDNGALLTELLAKNVSSIKDIVFPFADAAPAGAPTKKKAGKKAAGKRK